MLKMGEMEATEAIVIMAKEVMGVTAENVILEEEEMAAMEETVLMAEVVMGEMGVLE
jgi:hypothetical protein